MAIIAVAAKGNGRPVGWESFKEGNREIYESQKPEGSDILSLDKFLVYSNKVYSRLSEVMVRREEQKHE